MKMDGLSFVETVERLAEKYGVELKREEGDGYEERAKGPARGKLIEAHRVAQEFYAEQLLTPDAAQARQFLTERGFDAAAAETFGLGFAPREGEALFKHLRARGFSADEVVGGGLAALSQRGGSPYDRFRGRLLWPIREASGETIGFGARRIFDDDRIEAKYLNTSDTPIYKKSRVLYGIDLARREMGRSSQAVVVEGYTDVMACHLAGVEDRRGVLRHGVRRRARQGAAPLHGRPRGVPRRGGLHLRRRRGRAGGGDQGVLGRPELRVADLRGRGAGRARPVRRADQEGRRGGA